MTAEQFFTRYAALSMGDDDRALAALYAPSFFVAGPTGSMTFANDARFLEWLAQVRAFNLQHGMRGLAPAAVQETALSPIHVLAQVRWRAQFEKTGDRPIEFDIAYLIVTLRAADTHGRRFDGRGRGGDLPVHTPAGRGIGTISMAHV